MAEKQTELRLRLMTYNIGDASSHFSSSMADIVHIIGEMSPDIVVLQETSQYQDADDHWHITVAPIAEALEYKHIYFGDTLSMKQQIDVQKSLFVDSIFNDQQDWQQGNTILSRWAFTRLSNPAQEGKPRNIPIHKSPLYEGNRNTEDRYALLARIGWPPVFPYIVGVHMTTLAAERMEKTAPERSGTSKTGYSEQLLQFLTPLKKPFIRRKARKMRLKQSQRILSLLRKHVLETDEVVFLLGDFNASADEACISSVLVDEGGFVRLTPVSDIPTHLYAQKAIDHIFFYPRHRLLNYKCSVVESINGKNVRDISDHLPVVAEVIIAPR